MRAPARPRSSSPRACRSNPRPLSPSRRPRPPSGSRSPAQPPPRPVPSPPRRGKSSRREPRCVPAPSRPHADSRSQASPSTSGRRLSGPALERPWPRSLPLLALPVARHAGRLVDRQCRGHEQQQQGGTRMEDSTRRSPARRAPANAIADPPAATALGSPRLPPRRPRRLLPPRHRPRLIRSPGSGFRAIAWHRSRD